MNDTPKEKAAAIRATLKYPTIEAFIQRYAPNISKYGVFFKTASPKSVGTTVKFELKIADGTKVLRGVGEVSWIRDTQIGEAPPGMGIRFQKLDSASRDTVKKILIYKKSAGLSGPSRFSDAPPPAANVNKAAEEEARLEAEEKARLEAEEKARLEAEEKARREAEEKARLEAEEKARREAEEAEKRKQRAKEKLAEHQKTAGKIEADEDEIDELVAAFDSIQMPGDDIPEEAPDTAGSGYGETGNAVDANANIEGDNLDDALFDDARPGNPADARAGIADLIDDTSGQEIDRSSDLDAIDLFKNNDSFDGEEPLATGESPLLLQEVTKSEPRYTSDDTDTTGESLWGEDNDLDAEPFDLSMPISRAEGSASDDIEELSEADMVGSSDEQTANEKIPPRPPVAEGYRVSSEPPLFSYDARPSSAPYESEEFEIEELDDVDLIEEIDEIEEIENSEDVDEMGINFNGLDISSGAQNAENRFNELINNYSAETRQPTAPPPPLLKNQTVDHALNNIFSSTRPPSPPAPPSIPPPPNQKPTIPAPDTLPADALPDSLANFIERKSMTPPARRSQPAAPGQGSVLSPQSPTVPPPGRMFQQESPWGPPVSSEPPLMTPSSFPAQPPVSGAPSAPPSQWNANPNAGMPGQQSAWPSGPDDDDDDEMFNKKKGFFGKLFGK